MLGNHLFEQGAVQHNNSVVILRVNFKKNVPVGLSQLRKCSHIDLLTHLNVFEGLDINMMPRFILKFIVPLHHMIVFFLVFVVRVLLSIGFHLEIKHK